jgi:hypothetical protein
MLLTITMCLFLLSLFSTLIVLAAWRASSRADAEMMRMNLVKQQECQRRPYMGDNRISIPLPTPLIVAMKRK